MIVLILICAVIGALAALYIARPLAGNTARFAAPACAVVIAIGALAAYWVNARPEAPGQPYSVLVERLRSVDPQTLTAPEQEEILRAALREDPGDAEAALLLGRYLGRTGRELEGVVLLERALRVEESARLWSELGQALVNLNGAVTLQARQAFSEARALDPSLPEPAFFLGAAAYEDGDRAAAADIWADILVRLDDNDPFRRSIAGRAADLLSRPQGGPGSAGAAPFAEAAREGADMEAVIAGMVDGLEARVTAEPDDLSGWLTLARARMMQNDPEAARGALARARETFTGEPGKLAMIAAMDAAFADRETDA